MKHPSDASGGTSSRPGRLLRLEEAADYLQVTMSAIYKMTGPSARLRIPHVRLGGRIRFRQEDLDRWVLLQRLSNVETLEKVRRAAEKLVRVKADGSDSQTTAA